MSIIHNDCSKINCFKFTNSNKLRKCSLQDIENSKDESIVLVEINFFGINQVYSLMDISKIQNGANTIREWIHEDAMLSLTRVIGDSPILEGVNLKTRQIRLDNLTYVDWILIYQLNDLLNGMNDISDIDNVYDLQIGKELDIPYFNLSKSDYSTSNILDTNFKYIIKYKDDNYEFTDDITNKDFSGIFINIPEFNCWQYLSKKKFDNLIYPKNIEIKYAITDSPRCFSRVSYFNCYSISDIENLIRYCIYIPVDIYFRKEFDDKSSTTDNKTYDALEIVIEGTDHTISVLLTHDELGIEFIKSKSTNNVLFMDKFCLLKLINNIICLKPY